MKEKVKANLKTEIKKTKKRELILYNDEVNTFDFVIQTLIDVCEHDPLQAEQCTFLVHFKGKCAVKSGGFVELKPIYNEMINRSLTVEIH